MQTMLVTGANGFLAGRIAAHYQHSYHVVPLTRHEADITDAGQVLAAIQQAAPDIVVHCAAVSDTGMAEAQPEHSYAVNVQGSIHIAQACKAVGARLLHMSSDQIYNGCTALGPLAETVPVAPENVYGRHKLEAEQAIAAILPQAVSLRLTWMYDLPVQGLKTSSNLLCNLMKASLQGQTLKFPVREIRGVTWVHEIVRQIPLLAALPGGVYNAGSTSEQHETAYEVALYAAKMLGVTSDERLVEPDLLRYGAHVRNLNMNTQKAAAHGIAFSATAQGIDACLRAYGVFTERET